MRIRLSCIGTLGLLTLLIPGLDRADEPSKKQAPAAKKQTESQDADSKSSGKKEETRPEGLLPFIRFYDHNTNEHMYSLDEDELEGWRDLKHFKEHKIVGYSSPVELPETVRLWRAVGKNGRHFYYLRTPVKANLFVESEKFRVWVWKKPGEGRIPIYAHTWTDGGDVYFDGEMYHIRKFKEDSKKALGVTRPPLSGRDIGVAVFYVYPHVEEAKPEDSKETKKEPEAKASDK